MESSTNKLIILIIIFSLFAYGIGFAHGSYTTLQWGINIASEFIEFDKELVFNGIYNYQNNINNCFKNASIYNDPRD